MSDTIRAELPFGERLINFLKDADYARTVGSPETQEIAKRLLPHLIAARSELVDIIRQRYDISTDD